MERNKLESGYFEFMEHKKNLMISHILKYSFAQYFSQFLGFFTSMIMKVFLGPVYVGMWGVLRVVIDYASYANLGTGAAVSYRLPMLRGAGDEKKARELSNVVFNFVSITTFVCSVGVLIYAVLARKSMEIELFIGLLAVSVVLLTQRVYTYYMLLLRANKDFTILSKAVIFEAIANLSLILLIVSRFKLYGFYFVAIIMPVLNVLFIRRYITYELKFSFDLRGIYSSIRYGIPLFLISILNQILHSIDSLMIAGMLGFEQLGFYSIALMARSYGTGVSKNFIIIIQPYFLGDFNKDDVSRSSRHVGIYSQVTAYFMTILLSIVFITAPVLIVAILPKFVPGIMAMRIFLLATFFFTVESYPNDLLVALEKQSKLIPVVGLSIFVNILLNYMFIKQGFGISGVAVATSISALISFLVIAVYALKHSETAIGIMGFFVKIAIPMVYSAAALTAVYSFISFQNLFIEALLRLIVFMCLVIPLMLYLNRETGIPSMILNMIIGKIKRKNGTKRYE